MVFCRRGRWRGQESRSGRSPTLCRKKLADLILVNPAAIKRDCEWPARCAQANAGWLIMTELRDGILPGSNRPLADQVANAAEKSRCLSQSYNPCSRGPRARNRHRFRAQPAILFTQRGARYRPRTLAEAPDRVEHTASGPVEFIKGSAEAIPLQDGRRHRRDDLDLAQHSRCPTDARSQGWGTDDPGQGSKDSLACVLEWGAILPAYALVAAPWARLRATRSLSLGLKERQVQKYLHASGAPAWRASLVCRARSCA
jgi:hypothetical protein